MARPRSSETQRRTRGFLEQVAAGATTPDALKTSRMSQERFVRLLDDHAFFAVYQAVRNGALPPTAAVVYLTPVDNDTPAAA